MSDEGDQPQSYYGVELRPWEWQRIKDHTERISAILNRILRQGLRVHFNYFEHGIEPSTRELNMLKRSRQVLKAATETGQVMADCSSLLLRAHGFINPNTGELKELDDFVPLFEPRIHDEEWLPRFEIDTPDTDE